MKLDVLSNYEGGGKFYPAGKVIEVTDAEAKHLLTDSPGSFAAAVVDLGPAKAKAVKQPKANKQITSSENKGA